MDRHPDDLMSVRDVARALAVSTRTVYLLVQRGQLPPPVHVGRASRWRWRDVLRLVDRLRPGLLPAARRT